LESVRTDQGVLHVENGAFAETLKTVIGAWRTPATPVLLSGMVGSRQGWVEAPYLSAPAGLDDIAKALIRLPDDPNLRLAPGLCLDQPGQAPDVMRGEETQIIGVLGDRAGSSDAGSDGGHHLLVMPGTHSKWVMVEDGRIIWFATFMTGELFAVLKDHSILGRLMTEGDGRHHAEAFQQGLAGAKSLPGGLLQRLFSARTLGLFERLPSEAIAAYLSGLLIGSEINEALTNLRGSKDAFSIKVIGSSALAERYLDAIAQTGLVVDKADADAAARGQFLIARQAGLLAP
jgi:2-dehydro-3-deoxygalactonokinase